MDIEEIATFTLWTIFAVTLFVFGYPLFIGALAGHGARWIVEEKLNTNAGIAVAIGWAVGLSAAYAALSLGMHFGLFWEYGDSSGCTGARYQC